MVWELIDVMTNNSIPDGYIRFELQIYFHVLNQNISFKFEKGIGSKSNFVIENSVSEASVIFYTKNDDSGVRDSVTRLGDF